MQVKWLNFTELVQTAQTLHTVFLFCFVFSVHHIHRFLHLSLFEAHAMWQFYLYLKHPMNSFSRSLPAEEWVQKKLLIDQGEGSERVRNTCQSASHTHILFSDWMPSVSMATSVLHFCSVKIVPLTAKPLRLRMSHGDTEKSQLVCFRKGLVFNKAITLMPYHHNSWITQS